MLFFWTNKINYKKKKNQILHETPLRSLSNNKYTIGYINTFTKYVRIKIQINGSR